MTSPRVVLDTNVLISGLYFGGKPKKIIEHALAGRIQLFTSTVLIDEFKTVVAIKFSGRAFADNTLTELGLLWQIIPDKILIRLAVIAADPADDRVLECAVAAQADCIVSGDKHLLEIENFGKIAIMAPNDFLRIVDDLR